MSKNPEVSVVVPCFNEEGNIPILVERIGAALTGKVTFEIILVDDGSSDTTLETLQCLDREVEQVRFVSLSRNFGHQQALRAGLDRAKGDCVVMMDADLQHPPELILALIERWRAGFEVVYTVRKRERGLPLLKKITSKIFYKFINSLSDFPIDEGAADFRLLDRKVVSIICSIYDPFLFLRGLIPWMGFRQSRIEYEPDKRLSGDTKYSFTKMIRFALHGVTSFSVRPLRLATISGIVMSFMAFVYAMYAITIFFVNNTTIPGWASLLVSMLFLGGIQLTMLGIFGEYLGKLYIQSKARPTYIVREQSENFEPHA